MDISQLSPFYRIYKKNFLPCWIPGDFPSPSCKIKNVLSIFQGVEINTS